MLNWYEEQIRREEIEREITRHRHINEARAALPRCIGRLDRTLAWLGRGLVSWGGRLQQRGLTDGR